MPAERRNQRNRSTRRSKRGGNGRRATGPGWLTGRRRWLLRGLIALLVIWLLGCLVVIVEPTVNKPAKADAILVLGPPDIDGRIEAAYALARAHYAGTVVVSVTSTKQMQAKSACRNRNPDYQVICFIPKPTTTQGEAREIGTLARAHHWKSIIVVTSTYHISRARLIVERCMPGTVLMVAAPGKPSVLKWGYEFLYQTGAYVKALIHRGC